MTSVLVARNHLTPEQLRAVELSVEQHRVISGGPGSGKTQVLLHRARYLADILKVPPERFHIFVYTRLLKDYLRSASELLRIPSHCITTLDSWCTTKYRELVGGKLPKSQSGGTDFAKVREAVERQLSGHPPLLDFVLVDEAQDLEISAYRLLRTLAKHVSVCIDFKQQIYELDSQLGGVLKQLGLRQQNVALLGHYRNNGYVVQVAATFLDDPEERKLHIAQAQRPAGMRAIPVLYTAESQARERDRLAQVLQTRVSLGEQTAVLFPTRRQVFGYATGLREYGIDVEVCSNEAADFSSSRPKIMTYHSAKGLTFDSIMMPRLVTSSFQGHLAIQLPRLLFVGASRAVKWVYLSTVAGQDLPILQKLRPLADQGSIVLESSADDIRALEVDSDEDDITSLPY